MAVVRLYILGSLEQKNCPIGDPIHITTVPLVWSCKEFGPLGDPS